MTPDRAGATRALAVLADAWFDRPASRIARLVVHCPIRIPIPEPWPPDSDHAFLRPLRRSFEEGNPAIGTLHFVSFGSTRHHPNLALMTLLEGPGELWQPASDRYLQRRLIVFPGWGDGITRVQTKAGRPGSKTDHITFQEKSPGRVSGHLTPLSDQPEEKPYKASPVFLSQGRALHLCSFQIRQPKDADAAGLVWCRLATPSALPTAAIEQALHTGIEHDRHGLILPSPLPEWDSSHHLVVNVLLGLDPLEDKDYPVNPGRIAPTFRRSLKNAGKEGDILTRFVGIPLDSGRRAVVALSVRSGAPPNAWTLAMSNRGRK